MRRQMNRAILLARRQKRMQFLEDQVAQATQLTADERARFEELFSTARLLIAKAVQAQDAAEHEECEQRLSAIDRELTTLFSELRLMTSPIGGAAIAERPSGGAGDHH